MLPKPPKKYTINTAIRYYEHVILRCYFPLASVYKMQILINLKATQIQKKDSVNNNINFDNVNHCMKKIL